METYTYCYTTKMGVTQYARKTIYNENRKKNTSRAMLPLETYLINKVAKSITKRLF